MYDLKLPFDHEVKAFIQGNIQADVQKLILNPPKAFKRDITAITNQILARQKARGKLDTWTSNFDLVFPSPISVEQASSDETADYKRSLFKGHTLVDLTGGMGIDCLALSENFKQTFYVEKQQELSNIFKHNCKMLDKEIKVENAEASDFLTRMDFDAEVTFFIDPARRDEHQKRVFKLQDCTPDILSLMSLLREKGRQVIIKLSPLLDIKKTLSEIESVKEIHVVSVRNDCKELLLVVDFAFGGEPIIKTINIAEHNQEFTFYYSEEVNADVQLGEADQFLFEPNSAIMKAGAFKKIASDYNLKKIHSNTHLYTSKEPMNQWPGKSFKIIEIDANRKNIQKYARNGTINVLTRNYPLEAVALKKKYKVKDGGFYYLIGFKDLLGKNRLVIAERV